MRSGFVKQNDSLVLPWFCRQPLRSIGINSAMQYAYSYITETATDNDPFSCLRYNHPRFGKIKCIRTIAPVKAGDELTVEYGYDHNGLGKDNPDAPQWYKTRYEQHLKYGKTF